MLYVYIFWDNLFKIKIWDFKNIITYYLMYNILACLEIVDINEILLNI